MSLTLNRKHLKGHQQLKTLIKSFMKLTKLLVNPYGFNVSLIVEDHHLKQFFNIMHFKGYQAKF